MCAIASSRVSVHTCMKCFHPYCDLKKEDVQANYSFLFIDHATNKIVIVIFLNVVNCQIIIKGHF